MKKLIVVTAAGMFVLSLLTSGCEQKKAEETLKSAPTSTQEPASAPTKTKKTPQGC